MALPPVLEAAGTPGTPPPASRWGDLEPGPILEDSTWCPGNSCGDPPSAPFWWDLDIQDNYLFTAAGIFFEVHDISNPNAPVLAKKVDLRNGSNLPRFYFSDKNWFFFHVDAPGSGAPGDTSGTNNVVAMSGEDQGLVVWNTSSKTAPIVHYQDAGSAIILSVYATRLANRYWAFAADNTTQGGVLLYDLTAAQSHNFCSEDSRVTAGPHCAGVYKGRVGGQSPASVVHGAGDFLAVKRTNFSVEIWNVADPQNAFQRLTGTFPFTNEIVMWKDTRGPTPKHYLAGIGASQLRIYDISCITSTCTSLPTPTTLSVPDSSSATAQQKYLSFSWGGSTPYLYVGNENIGTTCVNQREYLIDVGVPSSPQLVQHETGGSDYWGWYYTNCPTGFNELKPIHAKFSPTNSHLYRAASSLLDSHELVGAAAPTCSFSWTPTVPNAGQTVTFTDQSSGGPDAWSWTFQDATPPTSASQNPNNVVFTSGGSKEVTLVATNGIGSCPTETQFVTVNELLPPVCNFTWTPATPQIGEQVDFSDLTTQAPTQWSWTFQDGSPPTSVSQSPQNVTFASSGVKAVTLTATNGVGTCPAVQKNITVTPPVPPTCNFTWTPLFPLVGEAVTFLDGTTGQPTQWAWTFLDGTPPTSASQNPQVSFGSAGNKTVTLVASNSSGSCPTLPKVVEVSTSAPLEITNFKASCSLGDCSFVTGQSIAFGSGTIVVGEPLAYDYDWDGNGSFEETSVAELASHVYCATGSYEPVLRIRRGSQSAQLADTNTTNLAVAAGTACSAPLAPAGLVATVLATSIQLDWNDNSSNEAGFRILRMVDATGFFPIAAVAANVRTYVDATAVPGVTYTYKVQAYATTGVGDSNTADGMIPDVPPWFIFTDGFESGDVSAWQ